MLSWREEEAVHLGGFLRVTLWMPRLPTSHAMAVSYVKGHSMYNIRIFTNESFH
jgi:hypothetical protein